VSPNVKGTRRRKKERNRKEVLVALVRRTCSLRVCSLLEREPGPFLKLMIRSLRWVAVVVESGGNEVVWAQRVE